MILWPWWSLFTEFGIHDGQFIYALNGSRFLRNGPQVDGLNRENTPKLRFLDQIELMKYTTVYHDQLVVVKILHNDQEIDTAFEMDSKLSKQAPPRSQFQMTHNITSTLSLTVRLHIFFLLNFYLHFWYFYWKELKKLCNHYDLITIALRSQYGF